MSDISQERIKYHELLEDFVARITLGSSNYDPISMASSGGIVYDIGKSEVHDYRGLFKKFSYKTIDRDPWKKPDIGIDIEGLTNHNVEDYLDRASALLCNGVIEQCDDPFAMIRACNALLRMDSLALFGMCLLGYPPHSLDRFRFTESGALDAMKKCGFEVITKTIISRQEVPSYIYILCRKVKE